MPPCNRDLRKRDVRPRPVTTLLQFVCTRFLGNPARGGSPGESYWCCPFHKDKTPSFHTLPHRAGTKDYWKCFGCGKWGDVLNLLRELRDVVRHPLAAGHRGHHEALIAELQQEWERDSGPSPGNEKASSPKPRPAPLSSPPLKPLRVDEAREADEVWCSLDQEERAVFAHILRKLRKRGVSLDALAKCSNRHEEFIRQCNRLHFFKCFDPGCGMTVCRAARGLPALTLEECERTYEELMESLGRMMEDHPLIQGV